MVGVFGGVIHAEGTPVAERDGHRSRGRLGEHRALSHSPLNPASLSDQSVRRADTRSFIARNRRPRQRVSLHQMLASVAMTTTRATFSLDESLAEQARQLGINVSAAARDGVAAAVRSALARADRRAYAAKPESVDDLWVEAEVWSSE